MMKNTKWALLSVVAAAMLAACGGGSSGGGAPAAGGGGSGGSSTTGVPVTVIDGAILNATVCLDKNLNGVCDTGEPFGKTNAAGQVTLQVPNDDVGKYPILAVVTTASTDADHGPVTVPFTMQAPADKTAVVSPLTTLVQTLVATTGASSADAETTVRAQTGINVSLFNDFTKGSDADSQTAGTVARMVVVVTQQQSSALGSAVGGSAIDGSVIKQSDLDKAIQQKLLEILPSLLTALADPSVQSAATPAEKSAALLALANDIVANPDTGLTPASVATVVAVNNQTSAPNTTPPAAETPTSGGNLARLSYTSPQNWFRRLNTSTAAQNTPDAAGLVRSVERRNNAVSGAVANWNFGSVPASQSDLHFNGTAWVRCGLNFENTSTPRNAAGVSSFNTCDNAEVGTSKRASFDIGGKTMASVLADVRTAGYGNLSIGDNTPGALTSALGSTVFPAGSTLLYQTSTTLSTAFSYYKGATTRVTQYSPAVAAGGTVANQAPGVGCNAPEFAGGGNGSLSTTLESLISVSTGTPCVYGQRTFSYTNPGASSPTVYTSDPVDEAWGNSTVSIGTLGNAPVGTGVAPGFYTSNVKFRIAFKGPGANAVTYYACKERFNTGATRNCTAIGTGSYAITTLDDARVLTLNGAPSQMSALDFTRVLVERGGRIYYGYQTRPAVNNSARLNLRGANALFSQLGIPGVNPDTPMALTATSYAGDWELWDVNAPNETTVVTLRNNGTSTCSDYANGAPDGGAYGCNLTITNPATGAFTLTSTSGSSTSTTTGTFDFLNSVASGTYVDTNPSATGSFTGVRR